MSQSFTSMDAGTEQLIKQDILARTKPLTKQDILEVDTNYLRACLRDGELSTRTRELMTEELERRVTPRYFPEPEGDPSY